MKLNKKNLIFLVLVLLAITGAVIFSRSSDQTKKTERQSTPKYDEIVIEKLKLKPGEFEVYTKEVDRNTDLVLVEDFQMSGAYNTATTLYLAKKDKDAYSFEKIPIIMTNDEEVYTEETDEDGAPYRTGFLYGDSYVERDYLAYGLDPCAHYYKYQFHVDRMIHVATEQAKGCLSATIESVSDIPENFDSTPVEVYKIKPEIFELAKNLKLVGFERSADTFNFNEVVAKTIGVEGGVIENADKTIIVTIPKLLRETKFTISFKKSDYAVRSGTRSPITVRLSPEIDFTNVIVPSDVKVSFPDLPPEGTPIHQIAIRAKYDSSQGLPVPYLIKKNGSLESLGGPHELDRENKYFTIYTPRGGDFSWIYAEVGSR